MPEAWNDSGPGKLPGSRTSSRTVTVFPGASEAPPISAYPVTAADPAPYHLLRLPAPSPEFPASPGILPDSRTFSRTVSASPGVSEAPTILAYPVTASDPCPYHLQRNPYLHKPPPSACPVLACPLGSARPRAYPEPPARVLPVPLRPQDAAHPYNDHCHPGPRSANSDPQYTA